MATSSPVRFDTPQLAMVVERLALEALDDLPFGVIKLDANGVVTMYNKSESRMSGFVGDPLGKLFFVDVAPCMDNGYFKGRIDKAIKAGKFDLSFSFVGDFADRDREFAIRAQSASDGGVWIFTKRNGEP